MQSNGGTFLSMADKVDLAISAFTTAFKVKFSYRYKMKIRNIVSVLSF